MARRGASLGTVRERAGRFYPRYERFGQEHHAGHGFITEALAWDWLRREQALLTEERLTGKKVWSPPSARRSQEQTREEGLTITLDQHARYWIEHRTTPKGTPLAPRTRSEYLKYLNGRLAELAAKPLVEVTRADVDEWWKANEDGHVIRALPYAFMKSVFKDAMDRGMIVANPCRVENASRRVAQRPKAVQTELITSITHAHIAALAEAMDEPRWRAFVLFLAYTGLRPGEALALERGDLRQDTIDSRPRWVVSVTKSVTSSRDKGLHLKGPKTTGSIRYVPLPPHMAEVMSQHLEEHSEPEKTGLIFPGTFSRSRYGTTTQVLGTSPKVRRGPGRQPTPRTPTGFYAARIAIGKPSLKLYDLRAWARSAWRKAGISDFDCELMMGHTLPKVAGAYTVLDRESLWPQLDRLSEQAGWAPPAPTNAPTIARESKASSLGVGVLASLVETLDARTLARTLARLPESQRSEMLALVPVGKVAAVISHLANQPMEEH